MPRPTLATAANPYGPLVTFRTQDILPPSAVYLSAEDLLVFAARAPTVSVPVVLSLRLLRPDGVLITENYPLTVKTVGKATFLFQIPPSEGFLLSASCWGATASRGQCFCKLYIQRGTTVASTPVGHLFFQGYVSSDDYLGYPQSPIESSLSGRGWMHSVVFANGALGANINITVPDGVHWILRALEVVLTTSAVVNNRDVEVSIFDPFGTGTIIQCSNQIQQASQNVTYNFAPGLTSEKITNFACDMGLWSEMRLQNGWVIQIGGPGIQAGDQFVVPTVFMEEYVASG